MRRTLIAVIAALAAPAWAAAAPIFVNIDQAARVTIPRPARDVIVGNPMVADVTVLDDHHILVMGKTYGVTNLMITDRDGRPMMNSQVLISAPDQNRVSVYRGPDVYNYACAYKCERTPMPGERTGGSAPYDAWAPPFNDYAGRAHNGETNSAQGGPTP
ncbi:MAG TPA: pilus assembly protein N-terminal domain-containing protein [Caulobacteraceae bacterium]|nr:pilus assembly protein N-terminal domain-containing protein [Caulobacteraceae bacterium]